MFLAGGWGSRAGGWFWFTRGVWLWYKWEGCVWWFRWGGSVVSWLFRWEFSSGGGSRLLVHVRRGRGISGMCYLNIRTEQVLCLWWEIFNFLIIYLISYSLWFFFKSSDCLKYGNFILSFLFAKSTLLLIRKNSPVGTQTPHLRLAKRLC